MKFEKPDVPDEIKHVIAAISVYILSTVPVIITHTWWSVVLCMITFACVLVIERSFFSVRDGYAMTMIQMKKARDIYMDQATKLNLMMMAFDHPVEEDEPSPLTEMQTQVGIVQVPDGIIRVGSGSLSQEMADEIKRRFKEGKPVVLDKQGDPVTYERRELPAEPPACRAKSPTGEQCILNVAHTDTVSSMQAHDNGRGVRWS